MCVSNAFLNIDISVIDENVRYCKHTDILWWFERMQILYIHIHIYKFLSRRMTYLMQKLEMSRPCLSFQEGIEL